MINQGMEARDTHATPPQKNNGQQKHLRQEIEGLR
jgi:hypothetical protein